MDARVGDGLLSIEDAAGSDTEGTVTGMGPTTPRKDGSEARSHGPGDTEAVVAPPPGHRRFPLIDSLRGLAVLYVIVAHGVVFGGGATSHDWYRWLFAHNIGIAMFFVVSGFVIYRPFVAHRVLGAPHPGIVAYARRRFLRIVPPTGSHLRSSRSIRALPGFSPETGGSTTDCFNSTRSTTRVNAGRPSGAAESCPP